MRLIAAEYSSHVRANVRVYRTSHADYTVDWKFSHGGSGSRSFLNECEALSYFARLNPVHKKCSFSPFCSS